jgi:hypothetical protein
MVYKGHLTTFILVSSIEVRQLCVTAQDFEVSGLCQLSNILNKRILEIGYVFILMSKDEEALNQLGPLDEAYRKHWTV